MRDDNSHDEDDAELDERVEALFDLLVAAGTESTANVAVDQFSQLLSTFAMNDLPDEPQPYDRSIERLVAVLETCRSMDEDDLDDEPVMSRSSRMMRTASSPKLGGSSAIPRESPLQSQTPQSQRRLSTGKAKSQAQQRRFSTGSNMPPPPPSQPPKLQEVQLQDQFDKEYSSTAYPKIGPGYSDTISVVSDLTTPTVMTGLHPPEENADHRHGYYRHSQAPGSPSRPDSSAYGLPPDPSQFRPPPRRTLNSKTRKKGGGGAAAQRRYHHRATLGRLGETTTGFEKIPESRPVSVKNYPSLQETPNAFPSVFPTDELSASLPHSPRHQVTKSLLRKSDSGRAESSKSRSRLSSSHSKRTKAMGSARLRKRAEEKSPKTASHSENVDVDGVLNTIGQDIDYIFRELSALEEDDDVPLQEEDVSVVSESNLSSTAKIKYTLGSVARTLKDDTDAPKLLRKEKNRLNWSSLDASLEKKRSPASSKSPQSSVTPKSDPLLIDEDGFIIHGEDDNDKDPFMTAAVPRSTFEGSFQKSERMREKSASTQRQRESSGRGSSSSSTPRSSTHDRSRNGTDEARARRRDSAKGSSTPQSSTHKRRHGSRNRARDEREEARARRRGSAKGSSSAPRSDSRHGARDGSGSRSRSSNEASRRKKRESSRSHHHEAKSEETATTSLSTTEHVKESRINGVEAATKQRIEVLRNLVKQTNSEDDALNTKLDFVEAETMKQIAKLRDRMGDGRQELIT